LCATLPLLKDKAIALDKAYTSVKCALMVGERLLRDAWADDPEQCPILKEAVAGYYVEFFRTRPIIPGLKIIALGEEPRGD
jgi:hypothetical protein